MSKIIQSTIAILLLSIFAMSCSKDDDAPAPVKPLSAEASFENTTEVQIADATLFSSLNISVPSNTVSNIDVIANGTILNLKKLVLEMNISHANQKDLSFTLIAPDGTESLFVKRVGDTGNYASGNKLRFSPAFTATLSNENVTLLQGNYKESQGLGSYATPILLPIFSTLQDKSINGTWKLKATDSANGITGAIKSWKIIFEAGALNQ